MDTKTRILGGLFGVACGDALGITLENMDKEEIHKYGYLKEIVGGGVFDLKPGCTTDDTLMVLCVAKGILNNPEDPQDSIGNEFMKVYQDLMKYGGTTVKCTIEKFLECRDWYEASLHSSEVLSWQTAGNGALKRSLPVALYYKDYDEIIKITKEQSQLTHRSKIGERACLLYNTLIYYYIKGYDKNEALKLALKEFDEFYEITNINKYSLNSSLFVVDSLMCAIWSIMNTTTAEEAICEAVNLGGDAGSIGAITGGLAGVYYGYDALPKKWTDIIDKKQELLDIALKLSENG
ncbi:ADP-ribosylglycohydrolase [Clostridium botulinum]|uniref:ADP-ribosylglycohydrolase family protein n=1 Tax=Clostridium botulinum TaxID=1491 RepID=UPI000A1750BC|nr:ADP-ribosylglycohydrolase family protein [Clostridium botulinum]AUN11084.1 ADP-ribosylglycohydrolase [Clostridium botulinum]AUN21722.1 ADP-ribosylglycohydrolase [Clostridium botulinum]AUN25575.1 ADP-ribosylglycohydrolase [Clostridium botulinum]OSA70669.1 ADP-ribosylglycohydrolase [Clostridium botulinum]QDY21199.1 ADP-ribosylglycohydrolase [Clostridium botulinum]